jgi:hypothetical protein
MRFLDSEIQRLINALFTLFDIGAPATRGSNLRAIVALGIFVCPNPLLMFFLIAARNSCASDLKKRSGSAHRLGESGCFLPAR